MPDAVILCARRVLRALEGRSAKESQVTELTELTERFQRLEDRVVDDMVDELKQLREGERFTRELLGSESRRTRADTV